MISTETGLGRDCVGIAELEQEILVWSSSEAAESNETRVLDVKSSVHQQNICEIQQQSEYRLQGEQGSNSR